MKQTLRIFTLLAVLMLTAGQGWATTPASNSRVKFVYASEHGSAFASAADESSQVTITIKPEEGWRSIDGDVTAEAIVVSSSVAESRRAEGAEGDTPIGLGETIGVTCTATNVFTLTLPEDANKNVCVTVAFRERLSFTPTVSITGWTFNEYDADTNAPSVSGNTSDGAVTYTYADTEEGEYTATVPTAAGTHYVKASIAATADYNAAEATTAFTIAQIEQFTFAEDQTWMTWCSSKAYTLPEGLKAYTVSGLSTDGKSVVLTPVKTIAADTPLLLKGTAGTTYTAPWSADGEATGLVNTTVDNVLTFCGNPTDEAISSGYTYEFGKTYVLYKGAFVLVDSNAGLPAHKCMLTLTTAAARQLSMSIGDETTGITTTNYTNYTNSEEAWFGIDGRKLQGKPATKGLYIYKGKKRVVR